jgi:hypothetical protein
VPKDYPVKEVEHLKVNEDIVNIENGIFKKKMFLSRLSTIRLVKENVKPPTNLVDLLENEKQKESKYRENKLEVTAKRPAENLIRTQIRWPNGIMSPEGKNYTGQIIPATRERIGHIQNVVPWDAQSSLIEISYPKGKPEGNEGMRLYFGNGPKDVDYLSFWVYPRLDKKARRKITALRFYFNGKFFEADLKTDTWQRVVISLNEKIKPPYWSNICFLADHKRHEFRKGRCASFELNGFATWGKVEKKNGETGLKNVRLATGLDSLSFTFLGKPGSYAEYRYYFKEPVEFKDYIALVNGKNEIVFRGKGWNALKHGIKTMRTIKKKLNITSLMFSRFQPYLNLNETLFKPFLFMVEPYTELPVSKMDLHYNACAQCLELKFHFPETLSEVSSSIARALTRKEKDLIKKKSLVPATLTLNFAKVIPEKNKGKRKK